MTDLRRAAEENGALTRFENGEECVDPMFEKGWMAAEARSKKLLNFVKWVEMRMHGTPMSEDAARMVDEHEGQS